METSASSGGAVGSGTTPGSTKTWLKRFGLAGFLFFLVKGLLWLIVPVVVVAARKAFAGGL